MTKSVSDEDVRQWMASGDFFFETGDEAHPHGPEPEVWGGRHLELGPIHIKRYGDGDCYLTIDRNTDAQRQFPIRARDAWTVAAFLMGYFCGRKESDS